MSLWSTRRSRKPPTDRAYREASLSFSFRKLNRIIGEIKSRRKSFSADRNIVVELMETAPMTSFPLFSVSSLPAITSRCEPATSKTLQSSFGNVSGSVNTGKLSASFERNILENKARTPHSFAAYDLRHVLTNPKTKQGIKLITLALLMLGFLCSGKATALAITIAAHVIVRLGSRLGILESLSAKPESVHSRSYVASDSFKLQISSKALQDQQELKTCTQEKDGTPHRRRLTPKRNQEHYFPASDDFKAGCRPLRRLSLRRLTTPVDRKAFSPVMNRVPSSGASDRVDSPSKSFTKLRSSFQRPSSAPVSPSSVSGVAFSSPLYPDRFLCQDGAFPEQENEVLSTDLCQQGPRVSAGLKLGAMLLLVLCGLHHGRIIAVFIASCTMLIFSRAQELVLPRKFSCK